MISEFRQHVIENLAKPNVRANFRKAMDGLMQRRLDQFPDPAELERIRTQAQAIRANALSKLPELLEQLEAKLTDNGIHVHWAETTEQANQIVLSIMQKHNAKTMIKGKSMVSEEMGLNHFLEAHGIDALESDLGEFILQLAHEPPSHIVAPAIHKSRQDVAKLFNDKFPDIPYTENIDELTQAARTILRDKFYSAEVGLSGVNFAVAETGTLCLVENEGNGRMSTTVPRVHIAVTGIEKVVEKLSDIPPLLSILTRSATGQPITTYFNMISSPRKPGEKDGPEEVHLVLLDNGRSNIYSDPELLATLRCIRCGACMNHCPVYTRIGGHSYGTVYPGPIGIILEPQKAGLDVHGELTQASTLCGACGEVCPVRIPIPTLINRLRYEGVRKDASTTPGTGSRRTTAEAAAWKSWSWSASHPAIYNFGTKAAARLRGVLPMQMSAWTNVRSAPQLADKTLHERMKEMGVADE
ncbi:MAG TPA: LutB/LldF family L-lactate oxidation iron-sulfur protein [Candidatus Thiothrix moscowensis]|uniref:LutB/LldF family L-lactate oxidation iron-sulfur protein n=1 Tax=unclassified Thiothrix TaxID=2636184 RepID=UPI0025DE9549|nr:MULTISPECIES: LutB/LldF family L-lactate oxidation iron-sulfur protein [unclassified Thiothrix]HRJ52758.1 LutB/LldF family L-lactate oxidation iron-sulfur protein [Candidatus Thiothrix moscowensis]HRJ92758.1 LutB/LldF family L-lactate oxidation iron-sulfur protein [Candidatus Thiothrix moscowensis]